MPPARPIDDATDKSGSGAPHLTPCCSPSFSPFFNASAVVRIEIDRLFDLVGQRFERDDAILSERRGDQSDDMHATAAAGDGRNWLQIVAIPARRRPSQRQRARTHQRQDRNVGRSREPPRQPEVPWCSGASGALGSGITTASGSGRTTAPGLWIVDLDVLKAHGVSAPGGAVGPFAALKDITRQHLLKLPPRPGAAKARDRRSVFRKTLRQTAGICFRKRAQHPFPQISIEIRAKNRTGSGQYGARTAPAIEAVTTMCRTMRSKRPSTVSGTP